MKKFILFQFVGFLLSFLFFFFPCFLTGRLFLLGLIFILMIDENLLVVSLNTFVSFLIFAMIMTILNYQMKGQYLFDFAFMGLFSYAILSKAVHYATNQKQSLFLVLSLLLFQMVMTPTIFIGILIFQYGFERVFK